MKLMTVDDLIAEFGEPASARLMPKRDADAFRGRVPDVLIEFWTSHGFGSYKDGYFVICDPRDMQPILRTMFAGDPEYRAEDITGIGYIGDSSMLLAWHVNGRKVIVTMDDSLVLFSTGSGDVDKDTGVPYSQTELIGAYLSEFRNLDTELFDEACGLYGKPAPGEMFGFVPALQLGGTPDAQHMRRVPALEHMAFLAQIMPLRLVEEMPPDADHPIGQNRIVRNIGPQP